MFFALNYFVYLFLFVIFTAVLSIILKIFCKDKVFYLNKKIKSSIFSSIFLNIFHMTDSERIKAVEDFLGLNSSELAKSVGLKTVQTLYDIKKGKHGISKDVASAIKAKYLNFNMSWLLTGEGEMINQVLQGKGNTAIAGSDNRVEAGNELLKAAIGEISEQRKVTIKAQEQIDRLLGIIENMNK